MCQMQWRPLSYQLLGCTPGVMQRKAPRVLLRMCAVPQNRETLSKITSTCDRCIAYNNLHTQHRIPGNFSSKPDDPSASWEYITGRSENSTPKKSKSKTSATVFSDSAGEFLNILVTLEKSYKNTLIL